MDINEKNMSLKDVLLHISKLIKNNKVEKAIVFFEKNPIVNKKYMLEYIFNGSVNLNDNTQMLANINYGKLDANLMSFLLNINPDGYLSKNFFLNVILNSKNFDINLPILLIENGIDLFENYSSEINEVYSQNKNKIYFNNKVLDKYDTINLNNNSNPEITLEQIILLKLINGLFHINIDDKKKINKLFKNNFIYFSTINNYLNDFCLKKDNNELCIELVDRYNKIKNEVLKINVNKDKLKKIKI